MTERSKVSHMLREVVLIVAGILIAFALNAWWEGRSEYATETDYLARLETDLVATDSALATVIDRHVEKVEVYRGIVALLGDGPSRVRADSLVALGYEIGRYTLFPESVRTYDELVNAGGVELITRADIRAALQDYEHTREDNEKWDDYQNDFSIRVAEPAVLERLPIRIGDEASDSLTPPPFQPLDLFDDLVFWNLARQRLDNEIGVLGVRRELLESIREAQSLVREELVRRGR